ncbi:Hypothetical predicted protein [Mytilus galloprovincialis]|uniref:B box-type domain-containing protein n=1 Tax=Mytilus galloprovincialis TaxID=29158 RepID=A0A8B6DGY2_MYTGA|nr:Hypothetical predicted protein [Mytilus galloprovincialis]
MADKLLNTCKFEPTFYCRFHSKETYQLYCKDCHDFVCFECLGEFHEKHFLCRLQDSEEDIRNQIGILFSEKDNCIKYIDEFSDIINTNWRQLTIDEGIIEQQIKTNAEQMREQIILHEKSLLSELHTIFKNFKISSQELTTRVENLQSDVNKFDVDKLPEYKLEEMINVLSELKPCTVACDNMKKYQRPNFNTDVKCGYDITEVKIGVSESMKFSSEKHFSVSTQTEDSIDVDTEDEWFDAEDDVDEDSIERSSDEIKEHNPLQICKLNKEIGRIKKICPISHTDAWILADRQLYKMVNQSLEDTVYADDAEDITVLKEGNVLILRNDSKVIMKLLKNKRLVRFANIGNSYYKDMIPYCFCNSKDDLLTVYLISKSRDQRRGYRNCILQMNKDGILTAEFNFYAGSMNEPCLMQNEETNLYVLYLASYYEYKNLHYINVLKAANDKCESIESFNGIFGYQPSLHF